MLLILLALRINLPRTTGAGTALSGVLLGLAAFFNQVHGAAALLGFAVFLLLRAKRRGVAAVKAWRGVAVLVFTFASTLLCLSGYYVKTAGFEKLWYCLAVNAFKYAAGYPHGTFGLPMDRPGVVLTPYLAIYVLLPAIYSMSLWRCWRSWRNPYFPWNQVALLSIIGVCLFLDVAVSINWLRLFAVSLPGIVLTVWAASGLQRRRQVLFVTASIALMCVAVRQITVKRALASAIGELPGGRLATTPQAYKKLRWLATHTHRGEFFLQAGWPGIYLPLQVRSPLYMPTLTRWDGVLAEDIQAAIEQMKTRGVRYVLWTHALDERCANGPCPDQLSIFRTYLKSSYRPAHTFDDGDVLWEKVDERMFLSSTSHSADR